MRVSAKELAEEAVHELFDQRDATALGVAVDGERDVLGLWAGGRCRRTRPGSGFCEVGLQEVQLGIGAGDRPDDGGVGAVADRPGDIPDQQFLLGGGKVGAGGTDPRRRGVGRVVGQEQVGHLAVATGSGSFTSTA
jgi:hypothetical protein